MINRDYYVYECIFNQEVNKILLELELTRSCKVIGCLVAEKSYCGGEWENRQ